HGHALRHSLTYLRQAKIATSITLLVLGISLALPAIFGLFVVNLRAINVSSEEANSLTLYLHTSVSDLRGVELAGELQQQEEIRFTRYISRDEALETFSKQFTLADAADTLDENPLPGAIVAVMAIDDDDETRIKLLSQQFESLPEVEIVKYDLRWIKRLHAILTLVSRAVIVIGTLLVITALLVIGNTIRLEMLRRADEIAVSRLIGASHGQIRRPFLYSGLIYGLLGGVLACLLVALVIFFLREPANLLAGLYSDSFELKGLNFSQILIMIGFSTLIGVMGAWLAVRWQIDSFMSQQS
ncbi:MAG: permease-like cell division protein FtsX, partial [Gammaproteobacteria bacterium]|nr:permease-like cell division protein FtsX [Gammaproteobacteria bacterium]